MNRTKIDYVCELLWRLGRASYLFLVLMEEERRVTVLSLPVSSRLSTCHTALVKEPETSQNCNGPGREMSLLFLPFPANRSGNETSQKNERKNRVFRVATLLLDRFVCVSPCFCSVSPDQFSLTCLPRDLEVMTSLDMFI